MGILRPPEARAVEINLGAEVWNRDCGPLSLMGLILSSAAYRAVSTRTLSNSIPPILEPRGSPIPGSHMTKGSYGPAFWTQQTEAIWQKHIWRR